MNEWTFTSHVNMLSKYSFNILSVIGFSVFNKQSEWSLFVNPLPL